MIADHLRAFAAVLFFLIAHSLSGAMAATSNEHSRPDFDTGKLDFSIRFRDEVSTFNVLAVSVLPRDTLNIEVVDTDASRGYDFRATAGAVRKLQPRTWEWHAPAGYGLYRLEIFQQATGRKMVLNAFVVYPASEIKDGYLNRYRLDDYFWATEKDRPIYRPPLGFIEVTPENQDTRVSPHFTLKQFLCKQAGGYPKYVVLRVRLLLKLELILEQTNAAGFRCDTFAILSGYRTPDYNKSIGNVKYSRHVWGGAADIFIDEDPPDGMMDDLNKDGKIDVRDAAVLYEIIDQVSRRRSYEPFVGGMGQYKKTPNHGPFVHVDTRGYHRRWGH